MLRGVRSFCALEMASALTPDGTINTTSYSGQIANVPEAGSCLALMGLALLGLEGFRRKSKTK